MIIRRFMISLLKSKPLWFWSIGFIIFWLFMGVFIFTDNINLRGAEIENYASIWFSVDSTISVSAVGVTIAYVIYYSSTALAYLFRNSRLTPLRYYLETSTSVGLTFTIIGAVIMVATTALFYVKFGIIVYPKLMYLSIILFFFSGMMFYSLSTILMVTFNNWLGLRNVNFVPFIPLFLGYGFGYTILYAQLPSWLTYSNFISPMEYLYIYAFLGNVPRLELISPNSPEVSLIYSTLSFVIWLFLFIVLSLGTIRLIKASYIEEARQI